MDREGPRPPFETLVAEHGPSVSLVCRSILHSDDLARDAAQETFVRLWGRWRSGAMPDEPRAWLSRVAVTTSLDLARRREVRSRAESERRVEPDSASSEPSPLSRAAAAELDSELERALVELPEGQRTIFVLRHRGGLPLREIAEALGLALPTVKTQFARACLRLQARLARFGRD
jgi:RNA polymerase sigma-70 factor, ECF subfamily